MSWGQEATLHLEWEEEENVFFLGKLHRLKCKAISPTDRKTKLIIKPEAPLKLLSPTSYKINSKKDQGYSASIKVYFPNAPLDGKDSLRCTFEWQDMEDQSILATTQLCLPIKERIVIRMEPQKSQIPIKSSDSLALIPLRINNMGKRKYNVILSLPTPPKGLDMQESEMELCLRDKNDTLINFVAVPNKSWENVYSTNLQFELKIKESGEQVADCAITAFPLGSTKKYVSDKSTINNLHEYGLAARSRGKNNNNIEGIATGHSPVKNGIFSYRLQSIYYQNSQHFELLNAMARYYKNGKTIRLGHVNFQGENSFSGRGIQWKMERDSQYYHLGYINGTHRLFEPGWAMQTNTGNVVYGSYYRRLEQLGLMGAAGSIQLSDASNNGMLWVSNTFEDQKKSRELLLGLSGQRILLPDGLSSLKPGFSVSANFSKSLKHWDYQSFNTYSTITYAGSSSGTSQFNEQIKYRAWESLSITLALRSLRSQSLGPSTESINKIIAQHRLQLRLESAKRGPLKFILAPYKSIQKRNYVDLSQPSLFQKGHTHGLRSSISFQKENTSASVYGDIGTLQYGQESAIQQSLTAYQLGFSFSFRNVNLNAAYNYGSTLLSDAVRRASTENLPSNFFLLSRWQKRWFDRKIKSVLSSQLMHNSIRGQWFNTTSLKLEYLPNKTFTLGTEFFVITTKAFTEQNFNLRLTKKIGNYKPPSGAKKLKVMIYEDNNNNGQKDSDEASLPGIFIQINAIPFVSNSDGIVVYKGVPIGEYALDIYDPSGNLAAGRQVIQLDNNLEVAIPMYRTGELVGKVKEIKQRFKKVRFELTGLPIVAKNPQGELFTTYTQPDGSFVLNLPENDYTVYLDTRAFDSNFELPDNYQQITVQQGEQTEVSLSVKVKSRKMTIQKF